MPLHFFVFSFTMSPNVSFTTMGDEFPFRTQAVNRFEGAALFVCFFFSLDFVALR
jgi:hypothetical protein